MALSKGTTSIWGASALAGGVWDRGGFDLQRVGNAFGERAKFHLSQKFEQFLGIGIADLKIVQRKVERSLVVQQHQRRDRRI